MPQLRSRLTSLPRTASIQQALALEALRIPRLLDREIGAQQVLFQPDRLARLAQRQVQQRLEVDLGQRLAVRHETEADRVLEHAEVLVAELVCLRVEVLADEPVQALLGGTDAVGAAHREADDERL